MAVFEKKSRKNLHLWDFFCIFARCLRAPFVCVCICATPGQNHYATF